MQSHVSTQTVEYPSFCFPADLVFQEGASICVNGAYSSLLICEFLCLHFACTKLYPIHEYYQHPVYAHFIVHGWNVTESFSESLHFVSLGLCPGIAKHLSPRTSQGTTIQ